MNRKGPIVNQTLPITSLCDILRIVFGANVEAGANCAVCGLASTVSQAKTVDECNGLPIKV